MSPVNEPPLFKGGGGGGRQLGLRESNQALAELKTKLEFALSRLNDQDTQRTGIEEIREFLQTLYPDWFPMVISCIGEAGTNLKPLGRCESVKLLGLLAELHGDAVVPLLTRILQVVVTRLQDADLHLREACAETVFRLARSLVVNVEGAAVFATLLKPLFGALGEHSKWVQIGAAACICSVIQGSPPSVVSDNLGRLCSRLVQHLSLPLAMAKPQLLGACIYAMEAVKGADFDEVLPALMPCLESCLNASSDWQTRKQAIEVLQTIGDNPDLGQSLELATIANAPSPTPLQRRIALLLEVVRTDKVRAVREAFKDVMLRWSVVTKAPGSIGLVRSGSPTPLRPPDVGEAPQQRLGTASAPRSSSPIHGSWLDREQASRSSVTLSGLAEGGGTPMGQSASSSMVGNAGVRQNRSVRASTREREEEVNVLVPPRRPGAPETEEAAEKARAIKAALSGAALNSTKKPRPKRERQSILKGPVNNNFFKQADVKQADGGEDMELGAEDEEQEALRASEMQGLQEHSQTQRDSPPRDRWPDDAVPETPAWAREGAGFAALGSGRGGYNDGENGRECDLQIGEYPEQLSEDEADDAELEPAASSTQPAAAEAAPAVSAATSSTGRPGGVRRMPSGGRPRRDQGGSGTSFRQPSPPAAASGDPGRAVSSSLLEELAERLQALEEDKREEQENLINTLQSLERTCEGQGDILAAQRQLLEQTERKLQVQEQQFRHQEERSQQQEQQIRQQEQRLHEQELQIQQLDQQIEEHQQVLREHDQQMEQQEQLLEEHRALVEELQATVAASSRPGARPDDYAPVAARITSTVATSAQPVLPLAPPMVPQVVPLQASGDGTASLSSLGASGEPQRPVTAASLRESLLQAPVDTGASQGQAVAKGVPGKKVSGPLWDKVLELCEEQRFLEAYKQVIAEPEETSLLRLMQHTGPIVEQLDAESNSRLIRRLIHILSSPKEPASACIEQVFSWLRQALDVGIHFTSSQVEDLAAALQKASAPHSFRERPEAGQLLSRVASLRRS